MLRLGVVGLMTVMGACAAARAIPTSGSAGASLRLEERSADDARRVFPERITEAKLPAVDRFAHRVWAEHAGAISSEVRICVRPNGTTESVNLLATSGMIDYDIEVVEGAVKWRYEPYLAPAATLVCRDATVTYSAK